MIYIQCMHGIGDQLYQWPFVKKLAQDKGKSNDIYVETPIPEIFGDIENLQYVVVKSPWRTQGKHQLDMSYMDKGANILRKKPKGVGKNNIIQPHYGEDLHFNDMPIIRSMENKFGYRYQDIVNTKGDARKDPAKVLKAHNIPNDKPIAFVRPSSIRSEWPAQQRAPLPGYLLWCSEQLRDMGYHVVSVADVSPGEEWIEQPVPYADQVFHRGELSIPDMLTLFSYSSVALGGSGWIVPAAQIYQVPTFLVYGGRGGFDAPTKTIHPTKVGRLGFGIPDRFCRCKRNVPTSEHKCDKRISNLDIQFFDFIARMNQTIAVN